jgi:hypothetical protein
MKSVYNRTPQSSLIVYLFCVTAHDHYKISEKIHTHSEYDTEWANLLYYLSAEKGYFEHWYQETMVGHESIILSLTFTKVSNYQELITEIDKYLNKYSWENVDTIKSCPIKDI